MKIMLITFTDIKGTVHFEFIPQCETVNQAYYVEVLKRLREAVRRKRPELGSNDWILHHDNAPANKACSLSLSSSYFLAQKSITEMDHPLFSPDLAPNDLWMFPKIKFALMALKAIQQKDFQKLFQMWQHRRDKCIAAEGEHFVGGPSQ
jgi:hypothetical protein